MKFFTAILIWLAVTSGISFAGEGSDIYPHANRTFISFDNFYGFQIEFFGANGKAHLWFPGNSVSVPSSWTVTSTNLLCFRYPNYSFNPATNQNGGDWECALLDHSRNKIVGILRGDPYHLATGRVPYVRSKCNLPSSVRLLRTVSCK